MNKRAVLLIFISIFAGLNIGSIRRTDDPVRDTQTNPILYEQKKEEEKDGKKGPLMYHVKNVPREGFLTDSPIEKEKADSSIHPAETTNLPTGNASWWEEEPKENQTTSQTETISQEPSPEAPSEFERVQSEENLEKPAEESKMDNASPVKGEDSWW